jgi:Domain of unknown function (DUF4159)
LFHKDAVCQLCPQNRREFFKISLGIIAVLLTTRNAYGNSDLTKPKPRAERVGWARLKTPNPYWKRHSRSDGEMARFLNQNTTLNIEPTWYEADVDNLESMVLFPFVLCSDLSQIFNQAARRNLGEYLKRGGFLFLDACMNPDINPSSRNFYEGQVAVLKSLDTSFALIPVPNDHLIYSLFYRMDQGLPKTMRANRYDPDWTRYGLMEMQVAGRTCGIFNMNGLQCGWDKMPGPMDHYIECMKMMANIYLYAMFQVHPRLPT